MHKRSNRPGPKVSFAVTSAREWTAPYPGAELKRKLWLAKERNEKLLRSNRALMNESRRLIADNMQLKGLYNELISIISRAQDKLKEQDEVIGKLVRGTSRKVMPC